MDQDFQNRAKGTLVGLAVGDALGAPVEFLAPGTFEPVTDFAPTPRWNLEPGMYTDDTIMAICLGEALVAQNGYDSYAVMDEYDAWFSRGKHTPDAYCFDIGNQTAQSILRYRSPLNYVMASEPRGESAGNGAIMRLAPVCIVGAHAPVSLADRLASISARETHYSREAEEATVIFNRLVMGALNGTAKEDLLAGAADAPDSYDLMGLLGAVQPDTYVSGAGYIRFSLEAAYWAFAFTDSFEACVLAAVNLGDDADTTAAIAGQLAGAYYGLDGIPATWRDRLWRGEALKELAANLVQVSPRIVKTRFEEDPEYVRV